MTYYLLSNIFIFSFFHYFLKSYFSRISKRHNHELSQGKRCIYDFEIKHLSSNRSAWEARSILLILKLRKHGLRVTSARIRAWNMQSRKLLTSTFSKFAHLVEHLLKKLDFNVFSGMRPQARIISLISSDNIIRSPYSPHWFSIQPSLRCRGPVPFFSSSSYENSLFYAIFLGKRLI